MRTLKVAGVEAAAQSEGLMDTTVVRIPFLALRSIGQPADARSFQFNRLIAGMIGESTSWPRYLHAELLHLTSLIYHPLIEHMPFDTRTSSKLFFAVRPAIGAATLFFPDRITSGNHQLLVDHGGISRKSSFDTGTAGKRAFHSTIRREGCAPRCTGFGCFTRGVVRSPPGAGIHYAGTVPMGTGPKRCDAPVDQTVFPISALRMARRSHRCPANRLRCRSPPMPRESRDGAVIANGRALPTVANRSAGVPRGLRLPASHPEPRLYDHLSRYLANAPFATRVPVAFRATWPDRDSPGSEWTPRPDDEVVPSGHPLRHVLNGVIALHECDPLGYGELAIASRGWGLRSPCSAGVGLRSQLAVSLPWLSWQWLGYAAGAPFRADDSLAENAS